MDIRRILFGERTPDKDDPKYRKLQEESEAAGRKFAELLHLERAVAAVQRFADRHSRIFLCSIFAFVLACLSLQLYRIHHVMTHRATRSTAVERQERELQFKRHPAPSRPGGGRENKLNEIYYYDETL